MIVMIRCVLYTGSLKASQIWNFVCTSVDYTSTIQGTKSILLSSTLFLKKGRFHEEADQGCRARTNFVQEFELPVYEGLQMGDSKQSTKIFQ
jgi:hypothetical protein